MITRVIVFILLLANLGYYAWTLDRAPRAQQALPPLAGDRLQLLSERSDLEVESTAAAVASVATSTAETARPGIQCFSLGPFLSQADLRRAINALRPSSRRLTERRETVDQNDGYWVFLPASGDRSAALALARELSEAGIRDYYVGTGGDAENTVSLGVFGEEANANSRALSVRRLGFDAQVSQRTESVTRYWIDYGVTASDTAPWERIVAQDSRLQHQRRQCG